MRHLKHWFVSAAMLLAVTAANAQKQYKYETVEGDPMKARIYTLDNGLRIYLTVNKDQPRIQTYIAVRVGGKNDPAETTGLAHYFEHLMFKGTSSFGTWNYEAEKPLLDSIETCFEQYRHTTDSMARVAVYHHIDSLSYEASKYAIANEYDKLMAHIGANGTNAYTSQDVTCYTEDIPSNELENWAKIQADRFKDNVIRGFHTELEAVYEEKNISLTRDQDKFIYGIMSMLFPHHPYGTQTVLGTQEQLKNPSITNIKNYYKQWYVPNNTAVCMSGDFDMEEAVAVIDKYFGDWQPNPQLPVLKFKPEEPLTTPQYKDVYGPEADMVVIGWRFPGEKEKDYDFLRIISHLVSNNKAGLFDINLNQQQKVLMSGAFDYGLSDYSMFIALAYPKEGQTLEEARDLMLDEIRKIAKGDFDDTLLEAIVNNLKLRQMQKLEDNEERADMFVSAFINGIEWKDKVEEFERLGKITKTDLMRFASEYLTNGYACVYKHKGVDPDEKKMEKPAISPIEMNRDKVSDFVRNITTTSVEPIQPVFVDYNKDLEVHTLKNGHELLYKQNTSNELFTLSYIFNHGDKNDRELAVAADYMDLLGTSKMSAEEFQKELYRIACDIYINVSEDMTRVVISGLSENMRQAMTLCEEWMNDAKADEEVYAKYVSDVLKTREMDKLEQKANFSRLRAWGVYGPDNAYTNILSAEELKNANPQALLDRIGNLKNYRQTICYYGPDSEKEVEKLIARTHKTAKKPLPDANNEVYTPLETPETTVYIAPYEAKNVYMEMFSNNGQVYNLQLVPQISLFNMYFGDNMSSIVFQELRESRGLAYNASAWYQIPRLKGQTNSFNAFIISQNDKLGDCIDVFNNIIEQMPVSETAFPLAKESLLKRLATERTIKSNVLNRYLNARRLGLDHDIYADIYEKAQTMTLDDIINFQQKNVKGRNYKYLILGDEKELDMERIKKIGTVHRVTTEEIFGY
ncbi:MAG: insulinase family protein [Bacteroides sp.]|nr:insulinase family protein [Roseburia sp.]MCM1347232.1 insulinase family protein [Bacteroides sp.]MCM1421711.1 insulinase family protein [Bacteroides sp.]